MRITLFRNLAACHAYLDDYSSALKAADLAVDLGQDIESYVQRGALFFAAGRISEVRDDFDCGSRLVGHTDVRCTALDSLGDNFGVVSSVFSEPRFTIAPN